MADFDPKKLLSLKLVNLSRRDRNWLLGQLPEHYRGKLHQHMTVAKRFKVDNLDELNKQLLPEPDTQSVDNKDDELTMSETQRHLQRIAQGKVKVAPKVAAFVTRKMG